MKKLFLLMLIVMCTATLFAQISGEVGIETDFKTSTISTASLSAAVSDAVTADISFTTTDWEVGISEFTITGAAGPVGIKFGYFDGYTEGAVKVDATIDIVSANFTTDFDFGNMAAEVVADLTPVTVTVEYSGPYTDTGSGSIAAEGTIDPVTVSSKIIYDFDVVTFEAGVSVALFGATVSADYAGGMDSHNIDLSAEIPVAGFTFTADLTDNFEAYAVGASYALEGITYSLDYADGFLFGISAAF